MFFVKNVKISVKINDVLLENVVKYFCKYNKKYSIKSNYLIILDKYIFVFFKRKNGIINHINVTKIPCMNEVDLVKDQILENLFINYPIKIISIQIDNITSIFDLKKEIDLLSIARFNEKKFNIVYNNERFPGLFVKSPKGTVIIFHTGKVVCVGCKNQKDLDILYEKLIKLIYNV